MEAGGEMINDTIPVGEALDAALKSTPFVVGFDGRMCNFSEQSECSIYETTFR